VNLREELGKVDVHDGLEKEDGFVLKWKPELEVSGGGQDGLDGSHAVVVMRLRRQLLRTQLVRRDDLL